MPQKTALEVLSTPDAMLFVAKLAEQMTIVARSAYRGVDEPDIVKLKAANETMHAITAKLVGLCRGTERFPNEAFLEALKERAGASLGPDLEWAIKEALRTVSAPSASN